MNTNPKPNEIRFPGNWNGIDKKVFELAISSTTPGDEVIVKANNRKYKTKTTQTDSLIQVLIFRDKKKFAVWQYDIEAGVEILRHFF